MGDRIARGTEVDLERSFTSTSFSDARAMVLVTRRSCAGSSASRTASPMKISRLSMVAITKKAVRPSHGACRLALPCASSSPSEGEPGGRPKPRKSSAVSVVIEPFRMKGMKVSVATMALGSRCLNMILTFESPSARAAEMYSKFRPRRNSARTTPTSATQENSSRMPSRIQKVGSMMAAMNDQQIERGNGRPDFDETAGMSDRSSRRNSPARRRRKCRSPRK